MKQKIIIEAISALLSLLFLYTGLSKILTYDAFSYDLYGSPLLKRFSNPIAVLLPPVEIIIALCLFIPKVRRFALWAAFILMLIFTLYVGYMLAFVPSADRMCTCGGIIRELTWNQHLWFNIIFTAIAFAGIIYYSRLNKKESSIESLQFLKN